MPEEMERVNLGATSKWISILGIIIPILLLAVYGIRMKTSDRSFELISYALFVGMEFIALVCGILGRRTPSGKAGLWISLVCMLFAILFAITHFLPTTIVINRVD